MLRTRKYNTGMINRFSIVEITIPPNTVVPTPCGSCSAGEHQRQRPKDEGHRSHQDHHDDVATPHCRERNSELDLRPQGRWRTVEFGALLMVKTGPWALKKSLGRNLMAAAKSKSGEYLDGVSRGHGTSSRPQWAASWVADWEHDCDFPAHFPKGTNRKCRAGSPLPHRGNPDLLPT